jgi:predicted small lipoprotein YifL
MRHAFLSFSLSLLAGALIAGCGSASPEETPPDAAPPDAAPTDEARLAESLRAWQDLEAADDGRYRYARYTSSFTGSRATTTFEVVDDVVTRRTYEALEPDGTLGESFDERGAEVGTNAGAAPPHTIDELYEICKNDVLTQDRAQNNILLTFHENGVLEYCEYSLIDCADDCGEGVDITSIDLSF